MSKKMNKGSKKNKASGDLLDTATAELKKLRRFAKQFKKLSTTQKIVGGLAVLAAGYALINNTSSDEEATEALALNEPTPASAALSTSNPVPPARAPKPRRAKPGSHSKHVPFSEEHS